MKRYPSKILLALLALSATQIHAVRFTNKTFAAFRPQGANLPMENTILHSLEHSPAKNAWLGTFQAAAFFQRSDNKKDLAKMFLFSQKDSVKLQFGTAGNAVDPLLDLELGFIVHDRADAYNTTSPASNFSLKLAPERSSYGLRVDYDHDLSRMIKGLHFHISAPVVSIQHHANRMVIGSTPALQDLGNNYFSGQFGQVTTGANSQAALQKGLIGDQRITGVADLDLEFNYDAVARRGGMLRIGFGGTIPTGNTPDGTYLFQPICGNGHHYAFGVQSALSMDLMRHQQHSVQLHSALRYRYLFEGTEQRTLGIKGHNFGQYHLLGKIGSPAATALVPAANILTQAVDVTPGHQFDGMAGLSYSWKRFSVDAGYNVFLRDTEGVRLRNAFTDGVYAVANRVFDTTAAGGFVAASGTALNQADLDLSAAQQENSVSHTAYLSLGMTTEVNATPGMLAVGGSYEFAGRNNSLEQWSLWGKAGISF